MLRAAVVIPIVRHDDPTIVFVKRAAHLRRNPGEIAFPGGLIDDADANPVSTALREFEEELGVPRDRVRIVDRLDDVVTLALSVTISPFVGVVDPPLGALHDAGETESVHEVPLRAVYLPAAVHRGIERIVHAGATLDVDTWLFDHAGIHVWGATARMLRALVERYPAAADLPL